MFSENMDESLRGCFLTDTTEKFVTCLFEQVSFGQENVAEIILSRFGLYVAQMYCSRITHGFASISDAGLFVMQDTFNNIICRLHSASSTSCMRY